MSRGHSTDTRRRRYARLAAKLGQTGLLLQGTITRRTIVREAKTAGGKRRKYGPYYQWTWKREGKTTTVNLTAAQARAYQKAIDNNRKVRELVGEMRELSLELLEATTQSVKKRKRRTPQETVGS